MSNIIQKAEDMPQLITQLIASEEYKLVGEREALIQAERLGERPQILIHKRALDIHHRSILALRAGYHPFQRIGNLFLHDLERYRFPIPAAALEAIADAKETKAFTQIAVFDGVPETRPQPAHIRRDPIAVGRVGQRCFFIVAWSIGEW